VVAIVLRAVAARVQRVPFRPTACLISSMNRAFSACYSLLAGKPRALPRALPWAGMNDVFGVGVGANPVFRTPKWICYLLRTGMSARRCNLIVKNAQDNPWPARFSRVNPAAEC
jgi:hypothetical protein